MRFQFPSEVEIGGRITVACTVGSGSPPFSFEWFKNEMVLERSSSHNILTGEEASALTFRQLTRDDSGNYTCLVKNREVSDSHTAQLLMKCKQLFLNLWQFNISFGSTDPPRWTKQPTTLLSVKEGSRFDVECQADGVPRPFISIMKNEGRIPKDHFLSVFY